MKTILCLATLDTKGAEAQYLKEKIEKRGHNVILLDIGGSGNPYITPDISSEDVAKAAGKRIEEVRAFKEAGQVADVMTAGAIKIVKELYKSGKFDGVVSIGGGMGCAMGSATMRELPLGVPKLMLGSQIVVQAGMQSYVDTKDITIMPSIADIAGLNRLTKKSLINAAGAIVGMVELDEPMVSNKPLVFVSMLGVTTACGLRITGLLEKKGFELITFHAVGIGGKTLEELVTKYPVSGVIELAINEIGNELFGGRATAGPNRLEAAGKNGIPQIITPGCADVIMFFTSDVTPDQYRNRKFSYHNMQVTPMRLNAEELRLVSATIAKKLNSARGPIKVMIPCRGFSSLDREGSVFYDPVADRAFIDSLRSLLDKNIEVIEIDAHINDEQFAQAIVDEFMGILAP